jgi:large subunit ribosomal protein L21
MSTYAIVRTGGKQYRVEQGQSLVVERLPVGDGETVTLEPLLFVDGADVLDGEELAKVSVEARVVAHERGPKLRVVKFKPKRGYKRRTGHRQELTRIEVTSLGLASGRASRGSSEESSRSAPAPVAAEPSAPAPVAAESSAAEASAPAADSAEASAAAADSAEASAAAADSAEESAAAADSEESTADERPTEEAENGS